MMTKLEELINEFCPDGVEYYSLSELFIQFSGMGGVSNKWADSGNCQFIDYMNAYNNISIDVTNLPYATVKNLNQFILRQGDILFTSASETPDECAYSSVIEDEITDGIFMDDHLFGLRIKDEYIKNISPSYLKYAFRSVSFRKQIKKAVRGVTRFYVSKPDFMKLLIPLPPLPIQSEIVHILDSFTLLTAELTAELTARQKQYAFYRDYLLDFSNEDVTKKIPDIDCSNVEYKRLGNIAIIERGKRVVRNDLSQKIGYPVYQNALNPLGYYTDKNRNANSVFIIGAGAAGEIGYSYVDYWAADDCFTFVCDDKLNQRYLYFLLMSKQAYLKNNVRKSSIPRLPRIALENMEIPVPPLSVQENIVKILDRFDKLNNDMSEGLPAEIEARKKQYEYYRDTLLSFDDKACSQIVKVERERELTRIKAIKWLKLGEIASIIRGGNFQKKDFVEQGKPCIHYGQIYTRLGTTTSKSITYLNDDVYSKSKKAMPNDIVMAVTSENIEDVCKSTVWLGNEDIAVSGHTAIIHPSINSKYLAYYFQTTMFFKQKRKLAHGTKVIEVTPDKLNDIIIPVPPLEEQERIVSILDRFDKLCNDISEGLPAEIEARQKQYEYYRDKLLMFKRVEANEK